MECEEVVVRLWEYLDQELDSEEAKAVDAHLSSCGCCHPAYCWNRAVLELLARQRASGPVPLTLVMWVRRWRRTGSP